MNQDSNVSGIGLLFVMVPIFIGLWSLDTTLDDTDVRISGLETRVSVLEGTPLPTLTATATAAPSTPVPTLRVMPPTPSLEAYESARRERPGAIFRPFFTLNVRDEAKITGRIVSKAYKDDVIWLETGVITERDNAGYTWVELYGGGHWLATGRGTVVYGKLEPFR